MANAKGKVTVGAVVDESLKKQLDERGEAEGRSRSEVIERACVFYLAHAEVERKGQVPKIKATGSTGRPRKAKVE